MDDNAGAYRVIAEEKVDDVLALQLTKGAGLPRLVIYNMATDKKKFTHLSWAEGESRSLKVKAARNKTQEYSMTRIREAVRVLVDKAVSDLEFKTVQWRAVQILSDLVHRPRTVFKESECMIVPETKRDTLWLAYAPSPKEPHRLRGCFFQTPGGAQIMSKYVQDGSPWPGIEFPGQPPVTMRNHSLVKELMYSNSKRWGEGIAEAAKAIVLGFKDWSADGELILGEALWKTLPNADFKSEDSMALIINSGKDFLARMIAYIRLHPILNLIEQRGSDDAIAEMEKEGLKRREKFAYISKPDHSRSYMLNRYASTSQDGRAAYVLIPENRLPGEKDRIYVLTEEIINMVLEASALGGEPDGQYATGCLIWALEMDAWLGVIRGINSKIEEGSE